MPLPRANLGSRLLAQHEPCHPDAKRRIYALCWRHQPPRVSHRTMPFRRPDLSLIRESSYALVYGTRRATLSS